jgi:hypothetical protein
MFAKTEDFNILHDYQLIVSFVEDRAIDNVTHIFLVSLRKK